MKKILLLLIVLCLFCLTAFTLRKEKEIVIDRESLTLSFFFLEQKVFKVEKHYTLNGDTITLPEGCVLVFKGGSIANGVIVGCNSNISASSKGCLFENVEIKGTWHVKNIYSDWFKFSEDGLGNTKNCQSMCMLTSSGYKGTIWITKGNYHVALNEENTDVFTPTSNTTINVDGNIKLMPNSLKRCHIIAIRETENITIKGKGSLVGDVRKHLGDEGEWGFGIKFLGGKNVKVKDITIKECWGDCICFGTKPGDATKYAENIQIENVTCDSGRRQGCSICAGKNITIRKSKFVNTGSIKFTAPGAGIDIEPDSQNTTLENVWIDNCLFRGNSVKKDVGDLLTYKLNEKSSIKITNSTFTSLLTFYGTSYNILIEKCNIARIIAYTPISNIEIKDSKILLSSSNTDLKYTNCFIVK